MASEGVIGAIMPIGIGLSMPPGIARGGKVASMDWVGKNLRWYMDALQMTEPRAAATLGLSQATINRLINQSSSRPNRNPSQSTLQKLARGMGVSVDALMSQDLSKIYADGAIFTEHPDGRGELSLPAAPQSQSQPVLPDLDRLGIALTAIDKALRDMAIQGQLGTLAAAVQAAYIESFKVEDIHDRAQLALYDSIVAKDLREWRREHGRAESRDAEAGAGQHREAASPRAPHGRGR